MIYGFQSALAMCEIGDGRWAMEGERWNESTYPTTKIQQFARIPEPQFSQFAARSLSSVLRWLILVLFVCLVLFVFGVLRVSGVSHVHVLPYGCESSGDRPVDIVCADAYAEVVRQTYGEAG